MRRYSVVLLPDAGSYAVVVPALPGCVTQGESVLEALAMARDAIKVWVEDLVASGEDVPEEEGPALFCAVEIDDVASRAP
jgi:antitoxin HicB